MAQGPPPMAAIKEDAETPEREAQPLAGTDAALGGAFHTAGRSNGGGAPPPTALKAHAETPVRYAQPAAGINAALGSAFTTRGQAYD